ncbi:glycosyl transferase group 1 [Pelosinus fermentans DSM 17108]|uniref:glycosyltransferase family 4 protein n=1 Tax=Pelosinus fermentans TaxID=365349 RepID=UPI0007D7CD4B|nr:glycosyltransferase family 4 protein [Pelosinus fermentans]OAM92767.1 glycosyl transferase group 1 [Pelosinus fermentans DSM 17108]
MGGQLAKMLTCEGIQHYLVPIRFNAYLASFMLERIIKKNKIELVHANSAAAGLASLYACQRLGIPLVYTAHGIFGNNDMEMKLSQADKIICVSEFLRKVSIERGIDSEKLITIYNGVNTTKFKADLEKRSQVRKELGIENGEFIVGIVSRIKNIHDKGHSDLLDMMNTYSQTANWRLLVVGKGNGLSTLKTKIKQMGLSKRVLFAGYQFDVPKMMQAVDVVVLPSKFETFGLVLAEAMAMKKPVVAYAVGGTPEAIEDGQTGFLVPKDNLSTLFEKINRIYSEPKLAEIMGDQGRVKVQQFFNNEDMLIELLEVYDSVLIK